jgi:hypothetical protein
MAIVVRLRLSPQVVMDRHVFHFFDCHVFALFTLVSYVTVTHVHVTSMKCWLRLTTRNIFFFFAKYLEAGHPTKWFL